MKKWVKYLLTAVLLFAVTTPLSVSAAGSGEAEFSDDKGSSTTLSLTIEDSIAQDMTSLQFKLLVEVTDGAMVPVGDAGSKFTFNPAIASDVKEWAVEKKDAEYIIDIIISGEESIFAGGSYIPATGKQVAKKKIEIGTLTLSPQEGNAFSAEVGLMQEEDPNASYGTAEDGSEILIENEAFDPTPILKYVEDDGIQAQELRMTNTNTVILSGGEVKTEPEIQPDEEEQNPGTQPGGEGQNPGTQSGGEEQNPGTQSGEEGQNPGTQSGGEEQNPGTQSGGEEQNSGTQPGGEEQNPGTQSGGEGQNPGTQSGGEEQDPGTQSGGEGQNPGTQPGGTDQNPGAGSEPAPTPETPDTTAPAESETETEIETESESESESETEVESETESELTDEETEPTEPGGGSQPQVQPNQPGTGDSGDNAKPEEEEKPPVVENLPTVVSPQEFDAKTAPKLQLSSPLAGSSRVRFEWTKVKGADGYEILQVKANGETKLIAEVSAKDGTVYEKDFSYDKKYKFKIRAFKLGAKNKKTYGASGTVKNVKTPEKELGKPGGVKAHVNPGSRDITITWKDVKNADGYQIFMRIGEDGAFDLVRTIENGKTTTCTVTKKYAETYTIRVAAFQSGKKGKPEVFGNYSGEKSVTTAPAGVGSVSLKSKKKGQTNIAWAKVSRADGYQIYRSVSGDGKYTMIKNIKKGGKVNYTDKTVKSGKQYYYKVRAYVTAADGGHVFGAYSTLKGINVK